MRDSVAAYDNSTWCHKLFQIQKVNDLTSNKLYNRTWLVPYPNTNICLELWIWAQFLIMYLSRKMSSVLSCFTFYLPRTLAGEWPPLSLAISSSSSILSKHSPLLFTLTSELALLLVACGEPDMLIVRLRCDPDRTLYIEDAGIFVISGRKFPGIVRLISCVQGKSEREMIWEIF